MAIKIYSAPQIARFSKRADSSIVRLFAQGIIKGEKKNHGKFNKLTWVTEGEKDELIALVHKHVPRGGYHQKKNSGKPKTNTPMNLNQVMRFLELPEETREMLLTIGEVATTETLEVLVGLAQ